MIGDISINGYNLIHADHPSNNKRGGACIYYCESLAVQLVKTNYLYKCLLCEVSFENKKGYIAVLYKPPRQNQLEFDTFISNFEKMFGDIHSFNPDFSIILDDFTARSNRFMLVILKHLKARKLILSELLMALDK